MTELHRIDCDLGEDCSCGGRSLLYIIGQPGSGKSTLVAALTGGLRSQQNEKPFAHIIWAGAEPVVELGARREKFSGTDALGMSVQPLAEAWLADTSYRLVLAEGDRLANGKFFTAAEAHGWNLTVVRVTVSDAVAEYRRASRAAALGTEPQNPSWLRGRVTKVKTLASNWAPLLIDIDGDQPPGAVLAALRETGEPVVSALTG